jgi:AhpD family alkylhydroperoxidase
MNEKIKELIAVGASVAAHCQPCLQFHVDKAMELGIGKDEIAEAIAVGKMVQKGGMVAMRKFADDLLDQMPGSGQPEGQLSSHQDMVLKIYEPAMCCSTGVCGPSVDSRLVAFAGALKQIASMGVTVERFNLAQQPQAFVENAQVKAHLGELGHEKLPFIYLNDELEFSGRYPEPSELFSVLGFNTGRISDEDNEPRDDKSSFILASMPGADADAGGCCPGGECC